MSKMGERYQILQERWCFKHRGRKKGSRNRPKESVLDRTDLSSPTSRRPSEALADLVKEIQEHALSWLSRRDEEAQGASPELALGKALRIPTTQGLEQAAHRFSSDHPDLAKDLGATRQAMWDWYELVWQETVGALVLARADQSTSSKYGVEWRIPCLGLRTCSTARFERWSADQLFDLERILFETTTPQQRREIPAISVVAFFHSAQYRGERFVYTPDFLARYFWWSAETSQAPYAYTGSKMRQEDALHYDLIRPIIWEETERKWRETEQRKAKKSEEKAHKGAKRKKELAQLRLERMEALSGEEPVRQLSLLELRRTELDGKFNNFEVYAQVREGKPKNIRTEWGPGGYVPEKLEWIQGHTIPKATLLEDIRELPLGERLRAFVHRESKLEKNERRCWIEGEKDNPDSLRIRISHRVGRTITTPWGRFRPNELLVAYVSGEAHRWNGKIEKMKEVGTAEVPGFTYGQLRGVKIGGVPLIGEHTLIKESSWVGK